MRLIDGDALIDKYGEWYAEELPEIGYVGTIKRIVDSMPTIELERKKGKWYKPTGMMPPEYAGRYRCSECDSFAPHDWKTHKEVLTDFCPGCGADMREGDT